MPVSGVYKIKGVGDVITGRIEQGSISPNDAIGFAPSGVTGKAFTIEMHHKNVPKGSVGDNVGVNVKGLAKDAKTQPKCVKTFSAMVFVQDHPGQLKAATKKGDSWIGGFTPTVHVRTAKAPCCLQKIKWKMGKKTGNQKVEDPPYIEAGEQAEVLIAPKMPFVCCPYSECKALGRMAAMDSNSLIMLGKITEVEWKEEDKKK